MATDQTVTLNRGASSSPLGVVVHVTGIASPPPPYRLAKGYCEVGSAASCDIVIDDPTVSRAHLELGLVPHGVSLRDLGSRNGTYYLGQQVQQAVLTPGARIEVGAASLFIELDREALVTPVSVAGDSYRGVVGKSAAMKRVFGTLVRLEGALIPVLLQGESGVGKELIARAVHDGSAVSEAPMVALNCAALPRGMVESELFGHRRGAFTGAVSDRKGAFESAHGGTLFLDEIGELPVEVQPVFLRALESGEVRRLGDDRPRRVDVRLICATNRDLRQEVAAGRFREDLFYRLAVAVIEVPPLRTRLEDIELLAAMFAAELGAPPLPGDVVEHLRHQRWPGNVRELRNAVAVYTTLGALPGQHQNDEALDAMLGERVRFDESYAAQKERIVDRFTRAYLERLLRHAGGNLTAAAALAKLDRGYFRRLLDKHHVRRG
jgi:transcriptional regulator with GAF, ATPase, and Fis domain